MSEDLIKDWISVLKEIEHSVTDLFRSRFYFREFMKIVEKNPDIPENNFFIVWIWENYLYNAAMGVRRLVDKNRRSVSLLNLLKEIKLHPEFLSRERYTSLFKGTGFEKDDEFIINKGFDELVGEGKDHLDPNDVKDEIQLLKKKTNLLKIYVNKTLAHLDKEELEKLPTIKDLDDCFDLFEKLVKKYHVILHADFITGLEPAPQPPWKEVLKIPWIQE